MLTLGEIQTQLLGVDGEWFPYQREVLQLTHGKGAKLRHCLYYRTGAGKTITAMAILAQEGVTEVLVLTPPIINDKWVADGASVGIKVTPISHAKFRQKNYKVKRDVPIIVDEFHLLGGHTGLGWKKFDSLARSLQAAILILSATPNYNGAERVYCVQHVLDPSSVQGGFLQFLYSNCETEENPFSNTPRVVMFYGGESAETYLAHLPQVSYVPDAYRKEPNDYPIRFELPTELFEYGVHRRKKKIIASQMEMRHVISHDQLVDDVGLIRIEVRSVLDRLIANVDTPTLIFCSTATVATAMMRTAVAINASAALVTGKDTTKQKAKVVEEFRQGMYNILIGTSTLATGTDGLDKICDHLIILQDTDDDAQRRQLIGRILPRGASVDVSRKKVTRINMLQ